MNWAYLCQSTENVLLPITVDMKANNCLMLKHQVCFSGGVQRTRLASADLLGPVVETLPLYSVSVWSSGGDKKEYKMQACSLRCLFPKNAQKGALGDRLPVGYPLPFELNASKISRPSLKAKHRITIWSSNSIPRYATKGIQSMAQNRH